MDDAETVLLIDSGKDQHSIDVHHGSPMMKKILELRNKYELHMKAEHCLSDEAGIADADSAFIKKRVDARTVSYTHLPLIQFVHIA